MNSFNYIEIKCATNPDFDGFFSKDQISGEMRDAGITLEGNNWIDYVVSHLDFPGEVESMIASDYVHKAVVYVDGHKVEVEKWWQDE